MSRGGVPKNSTAYNFCLLCVIGCNNVNYIRTLGISMETKMAQTYADMTLKNYTKSLVKIQQFKNRIYKIRKKILR